MKILLLTLGLATLTLAGAHAQGTINPLNGALTRVRIDSNCDGILDAEDRTATAADGIRIGVFWGPAGETPSTLAGEMTVGAGGLMTGLPSLFSVDGWGDAGTIISLQMRASIGNSFPIARTDVKEFVLAPASGPGTVVWGPSGFAPLVFICPEPSTLALGGLACAFLLFRLRKPTKTN